MCSEVFHSSILQLHRPCSSFFPILLFSISVYRLDCFTGLVSLVAYSTCFLKKLDQFNKLDSRIVVSKIYVYKNSYFIMIAMLRTKSDLACKGDNFDIFFFFCCEELITLE